MGSFKLITSESYRSMGLLGRREYLQRILAYYHTLTGGERDTLESFLSEVLPEEHDRTIKGKMDCLRNKIKMEKEKSNLG